MPETDMILYASCTSVKGAATAQPRGAETKQKTACVKNPEQRGRRAVGEEAGEVGRPTRGVGPGPRLGSMLTLMESSRRTRVTHETKDHLGECSAVFFSPLHLVEF